MITANIKEKKESIKEKNKIKKTLN